MSSKRNWAILGTGTIAARFAAALAHVPGATLAGVMSRDAARAGEFAAAYARIAKAPAPAAISRLNEVLADPAIDIIYIATPNHLHAGQAIACLEAGKSVLVEKPLAMNGTEARAIAAAAARSGRFCMEAMWTLCLPALDKARALIAAGQIGDIRAISANLSYAHAYDPADRFFNPDLGGGALLDLGVYPLAITLALMGQPREVRALIRRAANGVDLQSSMVLGFDGAQAAISCGFATEGPNTMTITGDRGTLALQAPLLAPALVNLTPAPPLRPAGAGQRGIGLHPMRDNGMEAARQMLRPLKPGRTRLHPAPFRGNGLIHQIDHAMACLRDGRGQSPLVPLDLSIRVLDVIDQVKSL